jgi:hypothetical protein
LVKISINSSFEVFVEGEHSEEISKEEGSELGVS